jgi:hypothetical protein
MSALPIAPHLEVDLMVTLSTAHVCKITAFLMSHRPEKVRVPHSRWSDYGWIVFVPENIDEYEHTCPYDLFDLLKWAKSRGYGFIKLDRDGPLVEGLTYFDW